MAKSSEEGLFKNRIIQWILFSRAGILFFATVMYFFGGLRPDEFLALLCLVLPITSLYAVLFIKYIGQNTYARIGGPVNGYFALGYYFILGVSIAENGLVLCRSLLSFPGTEWFYVGIVTLEVFLGALAGTYILDLFGQKSA